MTVNFSELNEHITRVSNKLYARRLGLEDHQNATLSSRETPSTPTPSRDCAEPQVPSEVAPHPSLVWDAKQDVRERFEAGGITETEALTELMDLGLGAGEAFTFLESWP